MKTVKQLVKLYDTGDLDGVVKQLRRYGTITRDTSFDVDTGYHAGAHRVCEVDYSGMQWNFALHNGEVKRVGYHYA